MRALCSVVAIVSAVAVAAPAAAAPWSPPATIPGAPDAFPALASGPSGPRAVYWSPLDATPVTFVSALGPGLVPGPAQPLAGAFRLDTGDVGADLPVVDARGRALLPALGRTAPGAGLVAGGPVGGPMALRDLPSPVRAVAVNAEGDAAVLVEACATRACRPAAPVVTIRRHGHGFGRPVALDRPGVGYGAAVAIDPHGRVLAAWDRDGRVFARSIGPRGRLGRISALGPEAAPPVFQVVLPGDGRAAVAWGSERFGGAGAGPPFTATVALAGAHGRFARHVLETVAFPPQSVLGIPLPGVVVRLPAHAPGVVAWTGGGSAGQAVRAATIRGTALGSPRTLSARGVDTILGDAAAGPRGEAVVLMQSATAMPGDGRRGLQAVVRVGGAAAFGAPEQVAGPDAGVDGADVAIDAASGAVFATWRSVTTPIGWSVRAPLGRP
jgi:hypothetical protein